jgi:CxxC-x17-CxxC domain-containing protein
MNNFKNSGPGGLRNRPTFAGGRPKSDADYRTKKKFGGKPAFDGNRGGDRGNSGNRGGQGDRGGNRGGHGGFGGNRGGERRDVEMFKTTCTSCGKAAEVPFRPDGSKPVLCRDCFTSNKQDDRGNSGGRDRFSNDRKPERSSSAPQRDHGPSPDYKTLLAQVSTLEAKMNEILALLKTASASASTTEEKAEVAAALAKEKKPKNIAAKKVMKKVAEKKVPNKVVKKETKKIVKKK